jgi:hypothetical protein
LAGTEFAEYRDARCGPIMRIIAAGRQTRRIRVLFEYAPNESLHVDVGLAPELPESFVNRFTHHVGQPNPALAKSPRLAEPLRIEPHVDQTGSHRCKP